jgi:hypothetical protein
VLNLTEDLYRNLLRILVPNPLDLKVLQEVRQAVARI